MKNTTQPEQFQNIIEKWYKQWYDRYLEHTHITTKNKHVVCTLFQTYIVTILLLLQSILMSIRKYFFWFYEAKFESPLTHRLK